MGKTISNTKPVWLWGGVQLEMHAKHTTAHYFDPSLPMLKVCVCRKQSLHLMTSSHSVPLSSHTVLKFAMFNKSLQRRPSVYINPVLTIHLWSKACHCVVGE